MDAFRRLPLCPKPWLQFALRAKKASLPSCLAWNYPCLTKGKEACVFSRSRQGEQGFCQILEIIHHIAGAGDAALLAN